MFFNQAGLIAQLRADLAVSDARADANFASAQEWTKNYFEERRRYDELLQTVLAMTAAGAQVVPAVGSAVEPAPAVPAQPFDELKALIAEKAGPNTELRGIMLRQLQLDRASGVSEEEIERRITSGVSSDGVPG